MQVILRSLIQHLIPLEVRAQLPEAEADCSQPPVANDVTEKQGPRRGGLAPPCSPNNFPVTD